MKKEALIMKKKTLLAPSLFLSGILLFSGCGSSATTSAVHQNKSADSWAVEASEPLDDSGFSYDGEADMMDDTATAETAGSSSDSSVSDAATDAAEARKISTPSARNWTTLSPPAVAISNPPPWILHRTATADVPTTSLLGSLPTTWIVSWKPPELWAPSPTKISKLKTSPSDTLIRKPTWIPSEPNTTVSANFSSRPLSWIRSWPSSPSSPTCATRSTATKPSFEPTTTW